MALVQAKGFLESSFNGLISSGVTTTANGSTRPQAFLGGRRNLITGFDDNKSAVPNGHLAPSAFVLPQKDGGMSSYSGNIARLSGAANGAQGRNIEATSSGVLTGAASGEAVAAGTATGAAALSGSATGAGIAAGVATGTGTLSGTATGQATASVTASGTAVVAGAATTWGLGFMEASNTGGGLTADQIAQAVWASGTSHATDTMGSEIVKTKKAAQLAAALSA